MQAPQGVTQDPTLLQVGGGGMFAGQAREQQCRLAGQAVQRNAVAIMDRSRHRQTMLVKIVEQFDEEWQLFLLALLEKRQYQLLTNSRDEEGAVFGASGNPFQGYQLAYIETLQKLRDLCVA